MHRKVTFNLLGLLLLTGALVPLLQACGRDTLAATEPYLHRVATFAVSMEPGYRITREYAGQVEAAQSSRLGFERPGQLRELLVDEGEAVTAGQVLARLDTRLLEAERDELTAQREELRSERDLVRRNLERISRLRENQLASEREQDELASRERVLTASLQRVEAGLDANRVRLDQSELKAPFAARIARRALDSGAVVDAGTPVFELVDAGLREVRAGIPVAVARGLAPGDFIDVRLGERLEQGRVLALGAVVNEATRSRAVRVAVDANWAPGELAYLRLEQPVEQSGAWIPDTAVTEGLRGTWVVYAAVDAGDATAELEARSVVIHHASGNRLYIQGAVNDGDTLVAAGLHRLAPGQVVRLDSTSRVSHVRPDA